MIARPKVPTIEESLETRGTSAGRPRSLTAQRPIVFTSPFVFAVGGACRAAVPRPWSDASRGAVEPAS